MFPVIFPVGFAHGYTYHSCLCCCSLQPPNMYVYLYDRRKGIRTKLGCTGCGDQSKTIGFTRRHTHARTHRVHKGTCVVLLHKRCSASIGRLKVKYFTTILLHHTPGSFVCSIALQHPSIEAIWAASAWSQGRTPSALGEMPSLDLFDALIGLSTPSRSSMSLVGFCLVTL